MVKTPRRDRPPPVYTFFTLRRLGCTYPDIWILSGPAALFDASLLTLSRSMERLFFLVPTPHLCLETLPFWGKLLTGVCEPRLIIERGSG